MRIGIWLVGGRGSVATTVVAGAAALRAGIVAPVGCVSELPVFDGLRLPRFDELVFGGHDIVDTSLVKRAEALTAAGVLPHGLADLVRDDLLAADAELRPGTAEPERSELAACERISADIADFRSRHNLQRVVVVNVASTEPKPGDHPAYGSWAELALAMREKSHILPTSSRYACAAFLAGCPFVDFTPSTGARIPALDELARDRHLPYAGSDGKTGETLVKSALAAMFARRALRVRSWSGTNLLGGGDGANLAEPDRAASKADSKALVLQGVFDHDVDGGVHIHNVPDLGEWKTAWDHIGFEGFLGVRMTMQFTWQGCDSTLAAPLVLDLARFTALAHQRGQQGALPQLGFFFKDPVACTEHVLERQFATLVEWATRP